MNDTLTQTNSRRIVDLSAKHRLPSIFTSREFVDAGGLMAYGPNFTDLYRRAATYVDISKHVGRVNRESLVVDEMVA